MKAEDRFFLAFCAAGGLAILGSTMSKNPILPLLSQSLGAQGAELGLIAAASTIPGILISLPAGSLSDLIGRRKVMWTAAFVFATAPFLYLLVTTPLQLAAVRFYHGFATAIFGPVANAAIVDRYPSRKAERLSLFSSSTLVGRSIAPFLGGGILLFTNSNYHDVYLVVGAAGVASLLAILVVFRGGIGDAETMARRGSLKSQVRSLVVDARILVASSVESAQYFVYGAFEFFIVTYSQSVGLGVGSITLIAGVPILTVVLTKPVIGGLSDRLGRSWPILGGLVISSIPLFVIPLSSSLLVLLITSFAYGLGFSTATSSTTALVSDLSGASASGSAMGFLGTMMDIGQALGPIVTGYVVGTAAGFVGGFWLLGLLLLVFAGLFLAAFGGRSASGSRRGAREASPEKTATRIIV
jgi:DHA1 family multidrug resistance protein-like MFS transporter